MKVLHFYKAFGGKERGGVAHFITHLAHVTTPLGVAHTVLSLEPRPQPARVTPDYVQHHAKEDFRLASTSVSFSAVGKFSELAAQADVVHYHFPWPYMDVAHFLARAQKPSIVTYHSDIVRQRFFNRLYQPLMRRFLGSVDAIVATSPNYLASSSVLAQFREKTEVIALGIDQALYPEPDACKVAALRERFGGRFFLFVGVLRYYKGLHFLMQALAGCPWPVVLAGGGPELPRLRAMADSLGLKNVHFIGEVSEQEKMDLLQACHAFVFPSHLRSEAFGISLLEASMLGRPMISAEIGTGTSFVNRDGETGIVVPPADPAALRQAMRILWESPELAQKYGRAARDWFDALCGRAYFGRQYLALYERVCATAGGRHAKGSCTGRFS
ncbi:glycosyltransferase [Orrella sp. JC864]|uniref:glycosyltransferase n=1 Tax=Orrella sp. JC864 TaxID=3120298 RepID=UPI00300B8972